jgi:transcriptional regulator
MSECHLPFSDLGKEKFLSLTFLRELRLSGLGESMPKQAELLPGTLDLLILKAVSLGPLHGYGILLRIQQISGGALLVEQGALYPALYRLEEQDLLAAEWGTSENNRRAKYYSLTRAGEKRLRQETESWNRVAAAMSTVLRAKPETT